MKTRARIGVLAAVITLFSLPLLAQSVHWIDTGASNVYTAGFVGIGTSTPTSALQLYPNQGKGINFKLYEYTYFGTIWSTFHTVLGGNVKASETDNVRMEYANTHGTYGGVAIQMAPNLGFVFHTAPPPSTAGATFNSPRMIIDLNGNVGIGTSSPAVPLDINGLSDVSVTALPVNMMLADTHAYNTANAGSGIGFLAAYNVAGARTTVAAVSGVKESTVDGNTAGALTFGTRPGAGEAAPVERMRIKSGGMVVVAGAAAHSPGTEKLSVNGNVWVEGTLAGTSVLATFQDVAEWVPVSEAMPDGTVVVVNPGADNGVMPSTRAYDTAVAGVVSARPGVILGVAGDAKAKIATTGRVKVRVDAGRGAIHPGDLLVTSDRAGMAMKSQPVEVAGVRMHRPGTLIGKALQPLERGEGEILVLLSLQ